MRRTMRTVDLSEWGRAHASVVIETTPSDSAPLPQTSYVASAAGVTEIPLTATLRPSAVFGVDDVLFPVGLAMVAAKDAIADAGPIMSAHDFTDRVYGATSAWDPGTRSVEVDWPEPDVTYEEAIFVSAGSKFWGVKVMVLGALAVLRQALGEKRLPIVAQAKSPPDASNLEAISAVLGYTPEVILAGAGKRPALIKRLWICDVPIQWDNDGIAFCPDGMRALQARLHPERAAITDRRSGIYITRRDVERRRVANDDDVSVILSSVDVGPAMFAPMTFLERTVTLQEAYIIAGPIGSNMQNALLAPPGGWIIEFIPEKWRRSHPALIQMARLSGSQGRRHILVPSKLIEGPGRGTDWDMIVDVGALKSALAFALAAPSLS